MKEHDLFAHWLCHETSPFIELDRLGLDFARDLLRQRAAVVYVEVSGGSIIEGFRSAVDRIIRRLIVASDVVVDDELHLILDEGLYNPRLSFLFETLWTARFEHREGHDAPDLIRSLMTATFDDPSVHVRCDAVHFWLALLNQNFPTGSDGAVLVVFGRPLDLDAFTHAAMQWAALGSPLRFCSVKPAVEP